jgi:hypothetical protein
MLAGVKPQLLEDRAMSRYQPTQPDVKPAPEDAPDEAAEHPATTDAEVEPAGVDKGEDGPESVG